MHLHRVGRWLDLQLEDWGSMDLLVILLQVVKDLLGNLNPLKLFSRDYRRRFGSIWNEEGLIFRLGYVVGVIFVLIFLIGLVFLIFRQALIY